MPTSQEIRAIVRAELRRLLAHAVDSFPPDPSPSSDSADPGLDGALGAWETLATGHRQGATVGEAMAAGRANPAAWGALCGALGLEEGARDGRRVGMALARLAGRARGTHAHPLDVSGLPRARRPVAAPSVPRRCRAGLGDVG